MDMLTAAAPPAADVVISGRLRRVPAADADWVWGRVWVKAGRIVAVTDSTVAVPAQVRHHDAGAAFVLPGAVDAHVHSLSHCGEGIAAATKAAVAGGVTTIVEMPFDHSGPINTVERLRRKQELASSEAATDIALLGTLAPHGGWREAHGLVEAGAVGFKVSLFLTDPARFPRIDDLDLQSVMAAVGEAGRPVCTHAENNEIISGLLARTENRRSTDPAVHPRTRPPISETLGVLTALESAADAGNALHLCHLSLPRSVDLVGWYQQQGVDVTLEVCPHYLVLTEADMSRERGRLKINPPLRSSADRDGLWDRLARGAITVISSDHAPWPLAMKDHERILDNHSGVPGVETLVSVTLAEALRRDVTLGLFARAVDALTINPARRYGIDHRKGSLEVGKDADVIVVDPEVATVVDETTMHSNARWSPYHGRGLTASLTHTYRRGRLVWSRSAGLSARPGDGELIDGPRP